MCNPHNALILFLLLIYLFHSTYCARAIICGTDACETGLKSSEVKCTFSQRDRCGDGVEWITNTVWRADESCRICLSYLWNSGLNVLTRDQPILTISAKFGLFLLSHPILNSNYLRTSKPPEHWRGGRVYSSTTLTCKMLFWGVCILPARLYNFQYHAEH